MPKRGTTYSKSDKAIHFLLGKPKEIAFFSCLLKLYTREIDVSCIWFAILIYSVPTKKCLELFYFQKYNHCFQECTCYHCIFSWPKLNSLNYSCWKVASHLFIFFEHQWIDYFKQFGELVLLWLFELQWLHVYIFL